MPLLGPTLLDYEHLQQMQMRNAVQEQDQFQANQTTQQIIEYFQNEKAKEDKLKETAAATYGKAAGLGEARPQMSTPGLEEIASSEEALARGAQNAGMAKVDAITGRQFAIQGSKNQLVADRNRITQNHNQRLEALMKEKNDIDRNLAYYKGKLTDAQIEALQARKKQIDKEAAESTLTTLAAFARIPQSEINARITASMGDVDPTEYEAQRQATNAILVQGLIQTGAMDPVEAWKLFAPKAGTP